MSFGQAISSFFSNYANFEGRSRRSALWWMVLLEIIVVFGLGLVGGSVGDPGILVTIWHVATLVPWLALWARRLHDIGMSGWWQLVFLIPFVGFVMFLIWGIRESSPSNNYGASTTGKW
jgi:uncharacterized membrane protein YhaH (DUF805 family)